MVNSVGRFMTDSFLTTEFNPEDVQHVHFDTITLNERPETNDPFSVSVYAFHTNCITCACVPTYVTERLSRIRYDSVREDNRPQKQRKNQHQLNISEPNRFITPMRVDAS